MFHPKILRQPANIFYTDISTTSVTFHDGIPLYVHYMSTICPVHYEVEKGLKMFNFEQLFLHGFSSKNREILHKAVLTSREYEDYFLKKKWEKIQKTCWENFHKSRLV